jgi:hypothetical protein
MKFRVEVISVTDGGAVQRRDVMEMERQQLAMAPWVSFSSNS